MNKSAIIVFAFLMTISAFSAYNYNCTMPETGNWNIYTKVVCDGLNETHIGNNNVRIVLYSGANFTLNNSWLMDSVAVGATRLYVQGGSEAHILNSTLMCNHTYGAWISMILVISTGKLFIENSFIDRPYIATSAESYLDIRNTILDNSTNDGNTFSLGGNTYLENVQISNERSERAISVFSTVHFDKFKNVSVSCDTCGVDLGRLKDALIEDLKIELADDYFSIYGYGELTSYGENNTFDGLEIISTSPSICQLYGGDLTTYNNVVLRDNNIADGKSCHLDIKYAKADGRDYADINNLILEDCISPNVSYPYILAGHDYSTYYEIVTSITNMTTVNTPYLNYTPRITYYTYVLNSTNATYSWYYQPTVKDEGGLPLPGIEITINDGKEIKSSITGPDGYALASEENLIAGFSIKDGVIDVPSYLVIFYEGGQEVERFEDLTINETSSSSEVVISEAGTELTGYISLFEVEDFPNMGVDFGGRVMEMLVKLAPLVIITGFLVSFSIWAKKYHPALYKWLNTV